MDDDTQKVNFEEIRKLEHRLCDQNTGLELDPKGSWQRGKKQGEVVDRMCRTPFGVRWIVRGLKEVGTAKKDGGAGCACSRSTSRPTHKEIKHVAIGSP